MRTSHKLLLIAAMVLLIAGLTTGVLSAQSNGVTLTISPENPLVNETITITISAPGASQMRLYDDDGDYIMNTFDGEYKEYRVRFINATNISFSADACFNGVWSKRTSPVKVTYTKLGDLTPIKATVPASISEGSTLAISFPKVENAKEYSYCIYPTGNYCSRSYSISKDGDPITYEINITADMDPGEYTLRLRPENPGYIGQYSYYEFTIGDTGIVKPAAPVVTVSKDQVYVGESVNYTITASGAESVRSRMISPYQSTSTLSWVTFNGDTATYGSSYSSAGDYSIQFSVMVDGVWSLWCDPVQFTVISEGTLEKANFTIPETVAKDGDLSVSLEPVENAEYYYIDVSMRTGSSSTYMTGTTLRNTVPDPDKPILISMAGYPVGDYTVSVSARKDKWETSYSQKSFTVTGDFTPTDAITIKDEDGNVLNGKTFTLPKNRSYYYFSASAEPAEASQVFKWSGNDEQTASVYNSEGGSGGVSFSKPGSVTVTVSAIDGSGVSASFTAEYAPIQITSIDIMNYSENVTGQTITLTDRNDCYLSALGQPAEAEQYFNWSSSDPEIATVNYGTVRFKKAGTVTITVKPEVGTVTASCTIKFDPVTTTAISIQNDDDENIDGKSITLKSSYYTIYASTEPSDAPNQVNWTSSDEQTASVYGYDDGSGYVSFKKPGTVTITASAIDGGDVSTSCTLIYDPKPTTAITIRDENRNIISETVTTNQNNYNFFAAAEPSDAPQIFNWSGDNSQAASVSGESSSYGYVYFNKAGTVTVTATAVDGTGISASVKVTYDPELTTTSITLSDQDGAVLNDGLFVTDYYYYYFNVSAQPLNSYQYFNWTVSDPQIATFSGSSGWGSIYFYRYGTVTVTATARDDESVSASFEITYRPYTDVIVLPSDLTTIRSEAFAGMHNVVFELPAGVTAIADDAFESDVTIICPEGSDVCEICRDLGLSVVEN